jgi:hypothetical protein
VTFLKKVDRKQPYQVLYEMFLKVKPEVPSPFLITSPIVFRALSGVLLRLHDESLQTGRVRLL